MAIANTVLAAYDGSTPSYAALQMAAQIAKAGGGRLVALYVIPPYSFPVDFYGQGASSLTAQHRAWAERILGEAKEKLEASGVAVETRILSGGPAEELIRAADAPDVRLLVVGWSGRGSVSRALLGSVADRVVRTCQKPVLVVR